MGYAVIILLNIGILVFAYFKFIAAIKTRADKSAENIKKEIARTVSAFNEEFDRNYTILEDRSTRLDKLIENADKYVNLLLHLDKKMDVQRVVKLADEIRTELEELQKEQKNLKQNIVKQRVHSAGSKSLSNSEITSKKSNVKLDYSDEIVKMKKQASGEIAGALENEKKSNNIHKQLSYNSALNNEKKQSLQNQEEIVLNEQQTGKMSAKNSQKNKDKLSKKSNESFVHKAYLSAMNDRDTNPAIKDLLEQTLKKDVIYNENENSGNNNLLEEKQGFKNQLKKSIGDDYLYNNSQEQELTQEKNREKPATGIQGMVFELLDAGMNIDEICSKLGISKGEAQLHYHIYNSKRKAE